MIYIAERLNMAKRCKWFAELDRLNFGPFMIKDRRQPRTPRRAVF
jgi:hypothetical protein